MDKISDCFIDPHEANIDNIRNFIIKHPLSRIAFSIIGAIIKIDLYNRLPIVENFIDYKIDNCFMNIKVDKYCPHSIERIKDTIQQCIDFNGWEDFIKVDGPFNEPVLLVKVHVD